MLLAVVRSLGKPVGLVILYEIDHGTGGGNRTRLGYLLSEEMCGKGLASEWIHGSVEWCRTAGVASIVARVYSDNVPSRRVLEKSGFVRDTRSEGDAEDIFRLRLQPNERLLRTK